MIVNILEKSFGDKKVFSNLKLEFKENARYALKAPSGWGKTTLLRILLGLDKDYLGSIIDPAKSPVVVFQEDRLVESLSVRANLKAVSDDEEMAKYLLGEIALGDEYNSKVSTLSGGMKRRVSIVRALLVNYDWLFLDEPFKGLDAETKETVANLILNQSRSRGIILITHDESEAELISARLVNLEECI